MNEKESSKSAIDTRKMNHRVKTFILALVFIPTLVLILSGCNAIRSTFGKDYRLVDDFFDQLEADMRFSIQEVFTAQGFTEAQKDSFESVIKVYEADMKIAKTDIKSMIPDLKELLEALGYGGSTSEFIEKTLAEQRLEIEQKLSEATDGQFVLRHTKVSRGFFGSIWHFIRAHWLFALIALGIIGVLWEKLEDIIDSISNNNKNSDK